MDRKQVILQPLVFFFGGVIVSVVGLYLSDYSQASATLAPPATRVNAAQRVALATRTSAPTFEPTNSPEPSATPDLIETPVSSSEVIPTLVFTPTVLTSPTPTITPTIRRSPTPSLRGTPTVTATLNAKKGDSPFTALDFFEDWQTIDGNKVIWYKLGEKTSYPIGMQIWLDAYGRSGIGFSVFSPEQTNDLNVATIPKGRGSLNKSVAHDLVWSGGSPNAGTWHVLVTNSNPTPVQYKLYSSYLVKDPKSCNSYWERLGPTQALVWWTACY